MLLQKPTRTRRSIQNLAALSLSSLLTCFPSTTPSFFTLSCSMKQNTSNRKEKKVSTRGCNWDSAGGRVTTRGTRFLSRFSNDLTLTVKEYDGLYRNTLFQAAETYLGSVIMPNTKRFRASKPKREKQIKVSMEMDEELTDWFGGVPIKWRWFCKDPPGKYASNPNSLGYGYAVRLGIWLIGGGF